MLGDLSEANKTVRLNVNASVGLSFIKLGDIQDLILRTCFDGSLVTRRDGT